jgi:hypothetical protein
MRASDARRAGRRGERGATLTLFAFVSGLTLLALGTVYLSSAEKAYSYSNLRAREAQIYAAADAGLVVALERLAAQRGAKVDEAFDLAGVHVSVAAEQESATAMRVSIVADSGRGGDRLERRLAAQVGYDSAGKPFVISAKRA